MPLSKHEFISGPSREFETCEEFFLEIYRTTFRGDENVDQWSDRDYWYKPD